MSSTNFNVGVAVDSKPSSRVLNPPGGVSSNIFGGPDKKELHPRNFKNQQNSSSMNEVMGTTDPNILINQKAAAEKSAKEHLLNAEAEPQSVDRSATGAAPEPAVNQRVRVPPGGFSSGLCFQAVKMTSTNFSVGLQENGRPTSRVLKPPGGGSSLVFCDPDFEDAQKPKRNLQNSSLMNGIFGTDDPNVKYGKQNETTPRQNHESGEAYNRSTMHDIPPATDPNERGSLEKQSHSHTNTSVQEQQAQAPEGPQQRKRVPPGGYSSGLW